MSMCYTLGLHVTFTQWNICIRFEIQTGNYHPTSGTIMKTFTLKDRNVTISGDVLYNVCNTKIFQLVQ